jgi:starch synthase
MKTTKVLFISQEIFPYLPESEIATICRNLPQGIQEKGKEIRTFMPKYGNINERRNQLHEVIRLSGMNLIIDENDYPLIIKVASIQSARMQVYFIDNEDYFQRKQTVADENNVEFEDNDERCIFFVRGVIETVRKLRWIPDIVHCHGWFTALAPLYIKRAFTDDPCFKNSKVVFSAYDNAFKQPFPSVFKKKLILDGVESMDLEDIKGNIDFASLNKLAFRFSDAIIQGSPVMDSQIKDSVEASGKPFLAYQSPEVYVEAYNDFYNQILEQ